jgi:hypothetical protein
MRKGCEPEQGEPDHLLVFEGGKKLTAQTTAKLDNKHFIDSKKAGDVIPQSARFAPDGYICFGRPDFQALAKEQAKYQGKQHNFKLVPIFALAELYVRYREGKLTPAQIATFLLNQRGYLDVQRIDAWIQQQPKP